MPTPIKKAHIVSLNERVQEIALTLRNNTLMYFNTRHLELFFSTPEELEIADEFRQWVQPHTIMTHNPRVEFPIQLSHPNVPLAVTKHMLVDLDYVYTGVGQATFWPRNMNLRPDADEDHMNDFLTRLSWMTQQRVNIALLRQVTTWLFQTCTTYEQIRWLFTPIVPILMGMGKEFRDIGRSIEAPKRVNMAMPEVAERQRLKWVAEFWATHELLGTFSSEARDATPGLSYIDAVPGVVDFGDGYRISIA